MVLDTAVSTVSARVGSFKHQKLISSTHKATLDRYLQQAQNSVLEIANQRSFTNSILRCLVLPLCDLSCPVLSSPFLSVLSNLVSYHPLQFFYPAINCPKRILFLHQKQFFEKLIFHIF